MKVSPTYIQEFAFVQLSTLPLDQQVAFRHWIGEEQLMTLQLNGIPLKQCVDYDAYNYWFNFRYQQESLSVSF